MCTFFNLHRTPYTDQVIRTMANFTRLFLIVRVSRENALSNPMGGWAPLLQRRTLRAHRSEWELIRCDQTPDHERSKIIETRNAVRPKGRNNVSLNEEYDWHLLCMKMQTETFYWMQWNNTRNILLIEEWPCSRTNQHKMGHSLCVWPDRLHGRIIYLAETKEESEN